MGVDASAASSSYIFTFNAILLSDFYINIEVEGEMLISFKTFKSTHKQEQMVVGSSKRYSQIY